MSKENRGSQLAARYRLVLDRAAAAEHARLEAARRRRERGAEERSRLLADLAAFAEALGHFSVKAGKGDQVTWSYEQAQLTFKAKGDADRIELVSDKLSAESRLRYQHELNRWVLLETTKAGGDRQRLLFDEGLEALMHRVFELRPAPEGEVVEPQPAVSLDEAVPSAKKRTL